KRVAMQWATRANEAYQTLRNPFKRAAYLCELSGIDMQTESNTAMPRDFLMQQMEWREALEDAKAARDLAALDDLEAELRAARKSKVDRIGELLDAHDYEEAAHGVRQLMFLEKFGAEVHAVFEKLES
ncbi:MAG TPA: Fe-S protein assembly co-chaperone HscB, partial [Noviherbaspirillum sp.]